MAFSKKFAKVAAVCSAAALGLAACGGSDSADSKPAEQNGGDAVTIEYLHRLDNADTAVKVQTIVDRWNAENPDIQIKPTKFDGKAQELIKKVQTDTDAGNAACLYQAGYADLAELYVSGLVQDVSEYASQYKDHFNAGPFESMAVNGQYFGLPQDTGPLVYFYNKAAFEELGLSVPTTAAEFIETAKAAAEQGKYIAAYEGDEGAQIFSAMTAAAGGQWFSTDGDAWTVDTTDAGSAAVADFWQQLLDSNAVKVVGRWAEDWAPTLASGELIGTIGAAWEAPILAGEAPEQAGDWAIAQLPDLGAGAASGPDGGSGVVVSKTCEFPEQAMKFNDWFNTQVDDLATQGLVVAATAAPAAPEYAAFFGDQDVVAEFNTANTNMKPFTFIPGWSVPQGYLSGEGGAAGGDGSMKIADVFAQGGENAKQALTDLGLTVK
ncbi:MAG: extracellular solute-binding protein [Actinomycetaceae bacterium]|nr:extracellular solute-binding protein [Arcanobacterium sp.]MDD7504864.1 extracellular solute-binding protein [Actinomycetaceae bacterium]MDY6142699.1 extracellular solute-binding protein [Arcanobacterium sp.]